MKRGFPALVAAVACVAALVGCNQTQGGGVAGQPQIGAMGGPMGGPPGGGQGWGPPGGGPNGAGPTGGGPIGGGHIGGGHIGRGHIGGGGPRLDANGNEIDQRNPSQRLTFATIPVPFERMAPVSFTPPGGHPHWYEVVYLPQGGVNWVQAKGLAEQTGGHLATIHSKAENDFVFSLIQDRKYWFQWDSSHNFVMNGPFLGGFQPAGSSEPKGGWRWVTAEPWTYENWAYDGMDGDNDPRPNGQPNDATGNQNVTAFGEVNKPVPTWGDFPHKFGSFNSPFPGHAKGFVIEYESPSKR